MVICGKGDIKGTIANAMLLCQTVLILESGKWKVNCEVMWNEENQPKRLFPIRRDKQELAGRGKALHSPFSTFSLISSHNRLGNWCRTEVRILFCLSNTLQENTTLKII